MASRIEETVESQEVFRAKVTALCIEGLLFPFGQGTETTQELQDAFHAGELVGMDQVWYSEHLPQLIRRN